MVGKPIEILMVEDNPDDVFLTQEILKESKLYINLNVVEDGVMALAFLHQKEPYQNAPRPDLILLDLNLPRKDGREVLTEIKSDNILKLIPIVVFTTSEAEQDILKVYALHANCYITKPVDADKFIKTINTIKNFWLTIVKLPQHELL